MDIFTKLLKPGTVKPAFNLKEYGDLPVAKGTVMRENGLRAADQPAREVDVTVEMQRKVDGYGWMGCFREKYDLTDWHPAKQVKHGKTWEVDGLCIGYSPKQYETEALTSLLNAPS